MTYVYKNISGEPINVAGYRFDIDKELKSTFQINRFDSAVIEKKLSLTIDGEKAGITVKKEEKSEVVEPAPSKAPKKGAKAEVVQEEAPPQEEAEPKEEETEEEVE